MPNPHLVINDNGVCLCGYYKYNSQYKSIRCDQIISALTNLENSAIFQLEDVQILALVLNQLTRKLDADEIQKIINNKLQIKPDKNVKVPDYVWTTEGYDPDQINKL